MLVRYIMQDDTKQSVKASKLIDALTPEAPGFLPLVAVVELSWVLSSSYGLKREQVAQAFDALLQTKEIVIECASETTNPARMEVSAKHTCRATAAMRAFRARPNSFSRPS